MPSSRASSQPRDRTQVFQHSRWILYHLSHQGSPRVLERVACPFSRGLFLTLELTWGLLLCRWILYQLSYQGSPNIKSAGSPFVFLFVFSSEFGTQQGLN